MNNNEARVVERFLTFKESLAYGIDQMMEPPGLGAYCDSIENKTTYVSNAALVLTVQTFSLYSERSKALSKQDHFVVKLFTLM